ncbi:MAG: sigma-54 dependent transcriptional regulator [Bacteroidales bacterium]|jgi:transcriptional regulator with PAS, ATPase and Fis domain|nr:sigma-54 dependent transcriptional regulator [Bacteroidales bacterium]MDD4420874.1 sigma-54 dependent transcriptional regulator [Bacteroidales bacterium]
MELQSIKQRFDIVGDDPALNRALDIAIQVAGTDLSVVVYGESGVGKEAIPQIIHQNSSRKHASYIAVNCGAIPEGTIDSELFGHEKGSFTGANETRKGYFEVADGGTIFLDEVAELPLSTQVRLLRVLQSGEFMKVGSSKVQKTNVRVVAATNVNLVNACKLGKFRDDLYYRLNTVPITIPPLRNRKNDIFLLFRKFALDFAEKYNMPVLKLNHDAQVQLTSYRWPGNIRQLKNVAEQMSVLEADRNITAEMLQKYLPKDGPEALPILKSEADKESLINDRDVLYKMIFSLKQEVDSLKSEMRSLSGGYNNAAIAKAAGVQDDAGGFVHAGDNVIVNTAPVTQQSVGNKKDIASEPEEKDYAEIKEDFSIHSVNAELIKKCLEKHRGRRKAAAAELGISERTLYRKIKELHLDK